METFNVGDRVIFKPIDSSYGVTATVTEVLDYRTDHPFGGAYGIELDEPWDELGDWTDTAAHGIELTKTGYVSLDTLLADG